MSSYLKSVDHINIVVKDLEGVKEFFVSLGFEVKDQAKLSGESISRVVGLDEVQAEYVKLTLPGDGISIELIRYDNPQVIEIENSGVANTRGFRHLAFQVEDIEETVSFLKAQGIEVLSEIEEYKPKQKKLIYFRGPEGILLELAEYGAGKTV